MTTQYLYQLTDTWNSGGTTFAGIQLNVTDTASAAGSLLMDLQVAGVSRVSARKDGVLTAINSVVAGSLAPVALRAGPDQVALGSGAVVNWSSTSSAYGAIDLILARDAANTLAQRNSTNAQAFRIYNTYTDASNYERLVFRWSSNIGGIFTDQAGTGTARNLQLGTLGLADIMLASNGSTRWRVSSAGHFLAEVDNTYDIGAAAANRPRTVYAGTGFTGASIFTGTLNGVFGSTGSGPSIRFSGSNIVLHNNDNTQNDFSRLQFGGTTSSFPALKRSSTVLQARLADDSDFAPMQGQLRTHSAYTAGAPTATGYLVLYDSNGTAYKVPAEAL